MSATDPEQRTGEEPSRQEIALGQKFPIFPPGTQEKIVPPKGLAPELIQYKHQVDLGGGELPHLAIDIFARQHPIPNRTSITLDDPKEGYPITQVDVEDALARSQKMLELERQPIEGGPYFGITASSFSENFTEADIAKIRDLVLVIEAQTTEGHHMSYYAIPYVYVDSRSYSAWWNKFVPSDSSRFVIRNDFGERGLNDGNFILDTKGRLDQLTGKFIYMEGISGKKDQE